MTPTSFKNWLSAMREAGVARSDAECARLLGISANSLLKFKTEGVSGATETRTALAMAALGNQVKPWGQD